MDVTRCQELVEAALGACSLEDVHAVCTSITEALEFDNFIYAAEFPTSLVSPEVVVISGFPGEWRERYAEKAYQSVDPTVRHCRAAVTPLVWCRPSEIEDPSGWSRRFVSEAARFWAVQRRELSGAR